MSFAATAEALFGPLKTEGDKLKLRPLTSKVKHWAQKLFQESKTMADSAEKVKVTVAYIRAKLNAELKTYMNLTEANCIPKYLMRIEEWERSHPESKSVFKQEYVAFHKQYPSSYQ